jgi:hypothetical protein
MDGVSQGHIFKIVSQGWYVREYNIYEHIT